MDLALNHPRSPYAELDGLPWLPRMIDKAHGVAAGTPGDYTFPCMMDRDALDFYAVAAAEFLDLIRTDASDAEISRFMRKSPRTSEEIAEFRIRLLHEPPTDEAERCALFERFSAIMPDVDTYAKAIAIDEGWPLPVT